MSIPGISLWIGCKYLIGQSAEQALEGILLAGSLALIILLVAGSDYNRLVISRFEEEIGAGLNAGLIRTMAGTGSVVSAAGLMFAFAMCGFAFGGWCGRS